jgi:hypothetical protein
MREQSGTSRVLVDQQLPAYWNLRADEEVMVEREYQKAVASPCLSSLFRLEAINIVTTAAR